MDKPYDVKALAERFKGRGLDLAEEAAKIAVEELFSWVEESAKLSSSPYDDMALLILPKLKDAALGAVDKIDSQVG